MRNPLPANDESFITPGVLNHILFWAGCLSNSKDFQYTKFDSNIAARILMEKKRLLNIIYVKRRDKKNINK